MTTAQAPTNQQDKDTIKSIISIIHGKLQKNDLKGLNLEIDNNTKQDKTIYKLNLNL